MAAHVHSRTGFTNCDGTQTITEMLPVLAELGFSGLALADHPTDPGQPFQLYPAEVACRRLIEHVDAVKSLDVGGLGLFVGLEASILPSDHIDAPASLTSRCDWVLASLHGGLGHSEKDPEAVRRRLTTVCRNPFVTGIGHPTRYNDETGVNWPSILAELAKFHTVVELNFNHWVGHAGQPPKDDWDDETQRWYEGAQQFWATWLHEVAESGVAITVGLDVHNDGMWPRPTDDPAVKRRLSKLTEFCELIAAAGISPERCLTSSPDLFRSWVQTPKPERGSLVTW